MESQTASQPRPDRQANLAARLAELDEYSAAEAVCRARSTMSNSVGDRIARSMPLGHSRGAAAFQRIAKGGAILSRDHLQQSGTSIEGGEAERVLGTTGDVFTYAGPFRYPGTSCGFIFRPTIETTRATDSVATPFDSGAILHHLRPHDTTSQQKLFLSQYELPVPDYRVYMSRLLCTLFASPWDYIDGVDPDVRGPITVEGGDTRRWTFEVRFEKELSLMGALAAVVLPVALAADLPTEIAVWKREGVRVKYYLTPEPSETSWKFLHEASVSYLREILS